MNAEDLYNAAPDDFDMEPIETPPPGSYLGTITDVEKTIIDLREGPTEFLRFTITIPMEGSSLHHRRHRGHHGLQGHARLWQRAHEAHPLGQGPAGRHSAPEP